MAGYILSVIFSTGNNDRLYIKYDREMSRDWAGKEVLYTVR